MSSFTALTYIDGERIDVPVSETYHKMQELWTVIGRRLASGFEFARYDFRDRHGEYLTVLVDLNDDGTVMSVYEDV